MLVHENKLIIIILQYILGFKSIYVYLLELLLIWIICIAKRIFKWQKNIYSSAFLHLNTTYEFGKINSYVCLLSIIFS